jgi:hypothetical protein
MWQRHLEIDGFNTLYFNAWENDFQSSPLVAIVSELKTLRFNNDRTEEIFKSILEKGSTFLKKVAPAVVTQIAKNIAEKYIGELDVLGKTGIQDSAEAAVSILDSEIQNYANKKKDLSDFKNELGKFVRELNSHNPLVFFIDELDRCRPNYAIEVLEHIKHFFSVRGIVFVLSIDKKHLESSVKGFYGTNEINSAEYLRRFIDIEFSIPEPPSGTFTQYLFDYFDFNSINFSRIKGCS